MLSQSRLIDDIQEGVFLGFLASKVHGVENIVVLSSQSAHDRVSPGAVQKILAFQKEVVRGLLPDTDEEASQSEEMESVVTTEESVLERTPSCAPTVVVSELSDDGPMHAPVSDGKTF